MAPVTDAQVERVRALISSIPAGRVATYGDIAAAAGISSPRTVGWILRTDGSDLPWHRVIRASGRPAPHLHTEQLELLRAEGVLSADGRVNLPAARHQFARQASRPKRHSANRTRAAVRAKPGKASAVDRG